MIDNDVTLQQAVLYALNAPQNTISHPAFVPNDVSISSLRKNLKLDIENGWSSIHEWVALGGAVRKFIVSKTSKIEDDIQFTALLTEAVEKVELHAENVAEINQKTIKQFKLSAKKAKSFSKETGEIVLNTAVEMEKILMAELDELSDYALFLRAVRARRQPRDGQTFSNGNELSKHLNALINA